MSEVMAPVPKDHPLMVAWERFKNQPAYANAKHWATDKDHVEGSLWRAFMEGFTAATERAASLHESINPASDIERLNGDPGAGAMGAVIEYRDAIRNTTPEPQERAPAR